MFLATARGLSRHRYSRTCSHSCPATMSATSGPRVVRLRMIRFAARRQQRGHQGGRRSSTPPSTDPTWTSASSSSFARAGWVRSWTTSTRRGRGRRPGRSCGYAAAQTFQRPESSASCACSSARPKNCSIGIAGVHLPRAFRRRSAVRMRGRWGTNVSALSPETGAVTFLNRTSWGGDVVAEICVSAGQQGVTSQTDNNQSFSAHPWIQGPPARGRPLPRVQEGVTLLHRVPGGG